MARQSKYLALYNGRAIPFDDIRDFAVNELGFDVIPKGDGGWRIVINGKPERVYAVHKNKIAYRVGGDKTLKPKWVFINTVTPIPIGDALFTGNGFKCVTGHDVTFGGNLLGVCPDKHIYKDDDCYVTVTLFGDGWYNITHVRYDGAQPTNSAMVRYLHELQHALKLFGIEKNIQL